MNIIDRKTAKEQGLKFYYTGKPCKYGHTSKRLVTGHKCYECSKQKTREWRKGKSAMLTEYSNNWRRNNPERYKEQRRAYDKRTRLAHPERYMVRAARSRAKQFDIPFNITKEDINVPEKCPVLGIPLVVGSNVMSDNSPTIDRIIPSKGYTKGNVVVISARANRLKSDASISEMQQIFEFYHELIHHC